MDRIMILTAAERWSDLSACLKSIHLNAAVSKRLSYGLVLRKEPEPGDLEEMHLLGSVQYLIADCSPIHVFSRLWQGEAFTLLTNGDTGYEVGWDILLLRMLHRLERSGSIHPALTGIPPLTDASVDAFRPVALDRLTAPDGVLYFQPGTPVRCSAEPQRTAFLSPFFCFSASALFRTLENVTSDLSAAAFVGGWEFFVPSCCPCRSPRTLCPDPEPIPEADSETWRRFTRRAGISDHFPYLNGQARTGILSADLSWDPCISIRQRILDRILALRCAGSPLSLLCVSAVLSEPVHPENTAEENTAYLRWLTAIRELPMIFLTDAVTRPTVQLNHPNVSDYSPDAGLPMYRRLQNPEDPEYLRLSRIFFLRWCKERNPGHSHYAWLDPCSVRYPVDPGTQPDLRPFCTDRITVATVGGLPDFSMIIVPSDLIGPLCGEISVLCESAARKPVPFPSEEEIWKNLSERFPSRFSWIPVSEKYGLIAHILRVSANTTCFQQ